MVNPSLSAGQKAGLIVLGLIFILIVLMIASFARRGGGHA